MRHLLTLVLILTLASTVFATDYHGDCSVVFRGDSTLHGFKGKVNCQPFTVAKGDGVLEIPRVSFPVAEMDTDNPKRDQKMREMFEEKSYPLITVQAGKVALDEIRAALKKGDGAAKVGLKLKIREIEKPVTATVTKLVESDSRIAAEVAFNVSLAEYQLKPPSVLGVIKVDDKVAVSATVVLSTR